MARALEQIIGARLLDLAAGIHHHHPVGVLGDDPHIVGDQDDRGAQRILQLPHQIEDLGLDRHIERCRRLVGDQQLRVARQRHRDHRALAHAARKLVWIRLDPTLRLRDMDAAQHLGRLVHCIAPGQSLVQHDRLGDLSSDRHQRVQRGHRFLEDHRDVVAANGLHLAFAQLQEVDALEPDGAADDPPRRVGDEAQDGQRGDAFAAAALADHAQDLSGAHVVGDSVHRPHHPGGGEEMGLQIVDLEQRFCLRRARICGRPRDRLQIIQE